MMVIDGATGCERAGFIGLDRSHFDQPALLAELA